MFRILEFDVKYPKMSKILKFWGFQRKYAIWGNRALKGHICKASVASEVTFLKTCWTNEIQQMQPKI